MTIFAHFLQLVEALSDNKELKISATPLLSGSARGESTLLYNRALLALYHHDYNQATIIFDEILSTMALQHSKKRTHDQIHGSRPPESAKKAADDLIVDTKHAKLVAVTLQACSSGRDENKNSAQLDEAYPANIKAATITALMHLLDGRAHAASSVAKMWLISSRGIPLSREQRGVEWALKELSRHAHARELVAKQATGVCHSGPSTDLPDGDHEIDLADPDADREWVGCMLGLKGKHFAGLEALNTKLTKMSQSEESAVASPELLYNIAVGIGHTGMVTHMPWRITLCWF